VDKRVSVRVETVEMEREVGVRAEGGWGVSWQREGRKVKEGRESKKRAGGRRASPVGIIVDERRRLNCANINPNP
jgi:hypothetical protein